MLICHFSSSPGYDKTCLLGNRIYTIRNMKSVNLIKMSFCLIVTYSGLLLIIFTPITESIKLPPVHWNSSNPMFKTSNNDHIIDVHAFDRIDFVCPYHPTGTGTDHEYYVIYFVSKREYDDCNVYTDLGSTAVPIVNCSNPKSPKVFTVLFDPFSSIPNVPEYQKGGTYYYITTSTGHRDGLDNVHQGACVFRNMKLTIKVRSDKTTTTTTTTTTPSPHIPRTTTRQTGGGGGGEGEHGGNQAGGRDSTTYKYTKAVDDRDENSVHPKHQEQQASHASSLHSPASSSSLLLLLLSAILLSSSSLLRLCST